MSKTPRGFIVWEGPSPVDGSPIVMVAVLRSSNRKTGDMVQTFILRADKSPLDALADGSDDAICGSCPLRGYLKDGKRVERACYVNVGQSVMAVWRGLERGIYPRIAPLVLGRMLAGRGVRLGSYGDPAMVPLSVLRAVVAHASMWTGYTHQWRTVDHGYSDLLMASADTVAGRGEARAAGWRSFYVVPVGTQLGVAGAMECSATRDRNPLQCVECGACAGTRNGAASRAVDVVIVAHGAGAKYLTA